jgi:hypothetical protein
VPEELLAAEKLIVGVLQPAVAQALVGEIVHVLEDRKPRHQPGRQRRLPGLVGIDRPEPLLQKAPVDRRSELRQLMPDVDDLIEPRPEIDRSVRCPAAPSAASNRLRRTDGGRESRPKAPINLQETKPLDLLSLQKPILAERRKSPENQGARDTSRATTWDAPRVQAEFIPLTSRLAQDDENDPRQDECQNKRDSGCFENRFSRGMLGQTCCFQE